MVPLLRRAATRCGEGQSHTHAAVREGVDELEAWAARQQAAPGYLWWELAAGASSSVAVHALLAAAADRRTTAEEAELIDAVYFPPIGALTVLLDDLIDRDDDLKAGQHNYLSYCASQEQAANRIGLLADRARAATMRSARRAAAPRDPRRCRRLLFERSRAWQWVLWLDQGAPARITRPDRAAADGRNAAAPPWLSARDRPTSPSSPTATAAGRRPGGSPWRDGHRAGAENVRARLRDAVELGIRELTVYAFSTENWSRSPAEVKDLIDLIAEYIDRVTPELDAENVRLRFIGERGDPVPPGLVKRMEWAEELTAGNDRITLVVPFNYGGRAEIVRAARAFDGTTEEEFRAGLYAPEMHDPELLIRTGGERRLSNYILWQVAESELIFTDQLWPDFSRATFEAAIEQFRQRAERQPAGDGSLAVGRATGPREQGNSLGPLMLA